MLTLFRGLILLLLCGTGAAPETIPFNEVSGLGLTEGQVLPPRLDKQTLLSALTSARQPTPRREP